MKNLVFAIIVVGAYALASAIESNDIEFDDEVVWTECSPAECQRRQGRMIHDT